MPQQKNNSIKCPWQWQMDWNFGNRRDGLWKVTTRFGFVGKNVYSTTSRMCNHGRHPLHGKSLSVQCNSIFPHAMTTPSGEITGGIIIEVLDALAWKLGFTYQISYDSSAYTLENGTVAGAYGKVQLKEQHFCRVLWTCATAGSPGTIWLCHLAPECVTLVWRRKVTLAVRRGIHSSGEDSAAFAAEPKPLVHFWPAHLGGLLFNFRSGVCGGLWAKPAWNARASTKSWKANPWKINKSHKYFLF